jgi:hypothetical protein
MKRYYVKICQARNAFELAQSMSQRTVTHFRTFFQHGVCAKIMVKVVKKKMGVTMAEIQTSAENQIEYIDNGGKTRL